MPNWVKGDLKVRGTTENLKKFLREGLQPCYEMPADIRENEWGGLVLEIKGDKNFDSWWIKNTHRCFIEQKYMEFEFSDNNVNIIVLENFMAAWSIDDDGLAEVSKKYGIDFKIFGFEPGMEFNQDVEIVQGEVVKFEEIKFDNYQWECIRPHIGG